MSGYLEKPWGHRPFVPAETSLFGAMHKGFDVRIVRLSVGEGCVELEWLPPKTPGVAQYRVNVARRGQSVGFANNRPAGIPDPLLLPPDATSCRFSGLVNGVDYEVGVFALNDAGKPVARSLHRLFRTGYFPGTVVNYIHPDDYTFAFSGRSTASPFLLELPSGALLLTHDVYWGNAAQMLTLLYRSDDGGRTWRYVTDICPCFWGKMFYHDGTLYLMGVDGEYGNYLIGCSRDEGNTWSRPVKLLRGGDRLAGGPHQAPTPVLFHAGRVWTAVEWGTWARNVHKAGILSADLSNDLMDPASWTLSPYVAHDPTWPGAVKGGHPQLLEGNVLALPDGRVGNLLRYHTKDANPPYGVAVLLGLDADKPGDTQGFLTAVALEGNYTKFHVQWDEETRHYCALMNRPDDAWMYRRDILSLAVSTDAVHWKTVADLINYRDNGWPEGPGKTGFQYPSFIFSGGDLLAAVRTALHGAYNFHNANAITFHRIHDVRREVRRAGLTTQQGGTLHAPK